MGSDSRRYTLGVIGGGFMGEAIVSGLVKANALQVEDICIVEAAGARRRQLSEAHEGLRVESEIAAAADCSALLLAVKPQDFPNVAPALKAVLAPEQVVVSIMAGVRVGTLCDALGHQRIVRVMPNTPAALGAGFSGWMATATVSDEQRQLVRTILAALGREAEVHEERYLDMVTAVSGSGPAYVFLFVESMVNAAVHIGLPRDLATEMVLQTISGSISMALASGRHPSALRDAVTSPGGTTAAALHVFDRAGFRGIVTDAIVAAYDKSRALGG